MSVAVPSHIARRGGASRGGGNSRGIYSAPFSPAHPARPGSSSHPPHGPPFLSEQADKGIVLSRSRGDTGGVFFFISSSHRSPRLVISSGVSKQRSHGTGLAIRIRFNNENIRQASRRAAGSISPAHPAHPFPSRPSCRIAGRGSSRPPSAHRSGPVPISRGGRRPLSSKHTHGGTTTTRQGGKPSTRSRHHDKQAGRTAPFPSRPSPRPIVSVGGATSPTQGATAALMASSSARQAVADSGSRGLVIGTAEQASRAAARLIRLFRHPSRLIASHPASFSSCRRAGRSHPVSPRSSFNRVGGRGRYACAVSGSSSAFAFHEEGGGCLSPSPRLVFFYCGSFVNRSYRRCSGWLRCCRRWKPPPW